MKSLGQKENQLLVLFNFEKKLTQLCFQLLVLFSLFRNRGGVRDEGDWELINCQLLVFSLFRNGGAGVELVGGLAGVELVGGKIKRL
jgi:hypothetical protein